MPETSATPTPTVHETHHAGRNLANPLDELKNQFILESPPAVEAFLSGHPAVVPLLVQSIPYLRQCFGPETPIALQVTSDEGPPVAINALALWRAGRIEARAALQRFDEIWGTKNLSRIAGEIVFDYELT